MVSDRLIILPTIAETFTINLGHCSVEEELNSAAAAAVSVSAGFGASLAVSTVGGRVRSMRPRSRPFSTNGASALMAITSAASLVETWSSFKSQEFTRRTSTCDVWRKEEGIGLICMFELTMLKLLTWFLFIFMQKYIIQWGGLLERLKKEKERDCKVCAPRHGQNEVTLDLPVVRSRQDAPLEKLW